MKCLKCVAFKRFNNTKINIKFNNIYLFTEEVADFINRLLIAILFIDFTSELNQLTI